MAGLLEGLNGQGRHHTRREESLPDLNGLDAWLAHSFTQRTPAANQQHLVFSKYTVRRGISDNQRLCADRQSYWPFSFPCLNTFIRP